LPKLVKLKKKAEAFYLLLTGKSVRFDVCVVNYYKDGAHNIGWHADRYSYTHKMKNLTHRDRQEIGKTTPIASFSLGAKRMFRFRSKTEKEDRCRIELESGSLLIMENCCQELYTHALPKSPGITEGRLNLTFRAT